MEIIVSYNKNRTIKIFSNIEKLANHSADFLMRRVKDKSSFENVSIALSGGSTPKQIFKYIADNYAENIDWQKLKIFFGDERCVPPNHNDSNFKMAKEELFDKISIPGENIYRIQGENEPVKETERYSEILKSNLPFQNNLPQFDIVMLGLGEDGHTASIFPDQIDKFYSDKICEVAAHPQTNQNRITISGSVINNAKLIVFIVTGEKKANIISDILSESASSTMYPASLVSPKQGELIWMLDTEASQLLDSEIKQAGIIL